MTFVYRYYDQAELERQLNARATVPDITPILARYAFESARMRERLPCRLGVSYGASEPERLDIFPTARGPSPIFVFLHGGYWRLLDSADSCFMAECLTQAGACVVSVHYALAPLVSKSCANAARRLLGCTRMGANLAAIPPEFMWAAAPLARISRRCWSLAGRLTSACRTILLMFRRGVT